MLHPTVLRYVANVLRWPVAIVCPGLFNVLELSELGFRVPNQVIIAVFLFP